jgi:hypothetical protein
MTGAARAVPVMIKILDQQMGVELTKRQEVPMKEEDYEEEDSNRSDDKGGFDSPDESRMEEDDLGLMYGDNKEDE